MSTEPLAASNPPRPIPPLENGDRLTRDEFERRYEAMPHIKKAELIEGVVYMPSPVSHDRHGQPHFRLIAWLGRYEDATPGTQGGDNSTVRLDVINEPQPDALLMIDPDCGGQTRLSQDGYIEHAPELVAEVSASSVSIDLNAKFEVYRRTGVREYLVWRVLEEALDWFILRGEQFERLLPDAEGIIRSEVFPGLWLEVAAFLGGHRLRVAEVVQQGLASAEHATFVQRLEAVRAGRANAGQGRLSP
jgi:Uma2 family endonuclease